MSAPGSVVLVRGGGDLGSGAVVALVRAGYPVVVVDLPTPTALRLAAAFASAAVEGQVTVSGIRGVHVDQLARLREALAGGEVPVWTGAEAALRAGLPVAVLVDARLRGLTAPEVSVHDAPVVIALGPGYRAGVHASYVIETARGPELGRVITEGEASRHTGIPGEVQGRTEERLLRSPCEGEVTRVLALGDPVEPGTVVARVAGQPVVARIAGMVRGLKLDGVRVGRGHKLGDIDPRRDAALLHEPSDKSQRVGAGVLEAVVRAGLGPEALRAGFQP